LNSVKRDFPHYLCAPWALLADTVSAAKEHRMARFGAWAVDLTILSMALPLAIGFAAVLFGYFKSDEDARPALPADQYPMKHMALRARGTHFAFVHQAAAPTLALPSPEPQPFSSPPGS